MVNYKSSSFGLAGPTQVDQV